MARRLGRMRPTRRFWAVAALGLAFAGLAVLSDRGVLLLGAVGLGAWLLSSQYRFVRRLARVDRTLSVEQTLAAERVRAGRDVSVALAAGLDDPSPLALRVTADPPASATGSSRAARSARIDPGEVEATAEFAVSLPLAGAVDFRSPTVAYRDPSGLFTEQARRGPGRRLVVEPRGTHDLHVGEGGDPIDIGFGEHTGGRYGSGIEPAETREYVTGDALRRIDWKATARTGTPQVRDYEAETDRSTVLLVDHREAMAAGPAGETKLDYGRQVALAVLASARDLDDPIGFYAVGDGGITVRRAPGTRAEGDTHIKRRLHDLRPTTRSAGGDVRRRVARSPAETRRVAATLEGDGSAFAATLRPYLRWAPSYVDRIEEDPLFATVRTFLPRLRGPIWTVVVTDDTDRVGVREAVTAARRGGNNVLVFLTPTVLFEPGGLADLEAAYARYRDFEEFRRGLAVLDRVAAFEVGPGDRLAAVLAARRGSPRARAGGGA